VREENVVSEPSELTPVERISTAEVRAAEIPAIFFVETILDGLGAVDDHWVCKDDRLASNAGQHRLGSYPIVRSKYIVEPHAPPHISLACSIDIQTNVAFPTITPSKGGAHAERHAISNNDSS